MTVTTTGVATSAATATQTTSNPRGMRSDEPRAENIAMKIDHVTAVIPRG